jgi:hypothetical protein
LLEYENLQFDLALLEAQRDNLEQDIRNLENYIKRFTTDNYQKLLTMNMKE